MLGSPQRAAFSWATTQSFPHQAISRIHRISATSFAAAFATKSFHVFGLPPEFNMTRSGRCALNVLPGGRLHSVGEGEAAIYGQQVINRLNFARGRILPSFQVNVSAGTDLYKSERMNVRFQADGENLTNVIDVIDFGGLFSGNAIGPSRSFALRLTTSF